MLKSVDKQKLNAHQTATSSRTRKRSGRRDGKRLLQKEKHPSFDGCSFWMQQQPIFPDRRQSSIFGAGELNFCVRYENRWDLTANVTAMVY